MKSAAVGFFVGLVVLSGAGAWWYLADMNTVRTTNEAEQHETQLPPSDDTPVPTSQAPGASIGDENLVQFQCDDGKMLTAVFARDIVGLTLSDGRQMELRHVEGDAIRYTNPNATIEFGSRGEDGYLTEGGKTTYDHCVARI